MFSHLAVATGLAVGDLLFYAICFIILMWLIKLVAWKPVNEMMQKRADKISDDIDSAEKSREEAAQLATQRQEALANSRQEASSIVDSAKKQGQQQRDGILAQAQTDAQSLKENAQKDIEQERQDALSSVRNDVADLSIEIASKIIQKELSADDQKALIDSYIEGLGK
ncbi:F0F1 ATP synthase subunit B [Secundilactobacillus similis]|jgi:F-type H+-transporting ATPase subunit b|uniref:ATP synthase subunit b n=1 Tax=Secundilactobacillus similis DSM 23365 = JCM 2765 TaxID=1423804 RepID=A0A0R2EPW7_9LACO|nr:F0F1 ATP synthase subunit B [Secundilactobacillus similis]KRN18081.1 F0F1 ATP synthase subunit B [Secundilactobacillus similis DSM 23365 = JCM 2765]